MQSKGLNISPVNSKPGQWVGTDCSAERKPRIRIFKPGERFDQDFIPGFAQTPGFIVFFILG